MRGFGWDSAYLVEVVLVHEYAPAGNTIGVPGGVGAVLVESVLSRKASIAGIAFEGQILMLGLVGSAVLHVLSIAIVGIKEAIALVAVRHIFGWDWIKRR
jgi:hypothetical protein